MKSFNTLSYKYIMTKRKLIIFDKINFFVKKLSLPKKDNIVSYHGYSIENDILKIVFWTNNYYLYIATLNEDTFEFSDWGVTK